MFGILFPSISPSLGQSCFLVWFFVSPQLAPDSKTRLVECSTKQHFSFLLSTCCWLCSVITQNSQHSNSQTARALAQQRKRILLQHFMLFIILKSSKKKDEEELEENNIKHSLSVKTRGLELFKRVEWYSMTIINAQHCREHEVSTRQSRLDSSS